MNATEFAQLVERLEAQYPDLPHWLSANCRDVGKTLSTWREALEKYSLAECYAVVAQWNSDRETPWFGKLHYRLADDIEVKRERARRIATAQQRRSAQAASLELFDRCRTTPNDTGFIDSFQRALRCKQARDRGELDSHDANRILHAIVESVR